MKAERLEQIAESYINGNISETKKAVKRMSKSEFVDFALYMAENYNKSLGDIQCLTW
jgi:hypothetical protein